MNPNQYKVQAGDTLSGIAQKFGIADYNTIAAANKIANPNLIIAGSTLTIPAATPVASAPVTASTATPAQSTAQPRPSGGGNTNSAAGLVAMGYQGYQGWSDAAAAADFAATKGAGKGGQTAPGMAGVGAAPTFDLVGATNAAYNTPEIQAAQKAIIEKKAALAKAQADIDDNPFYSEARRVGKSASLTDRANRDIQIELDKLTMLKADAQIKINAATGQYNINRQAYQDTLSQFNTLMTAGGLTNANMDDLANYSVQTGIPVSVLRSIQQKQQDDKVKTQLITGNDGTVSIIDTRTGKILSQTEPGVGEVKKATGGGSKESRLAQIKVNLSSVVGEDGKVSPDDYAAAIRDAIQAGYTAKNADSILSGFKNTNNPYYYLP